jgi:diadenosine tetraphosphatase ApaH/serine/threonine PP2A family protein phosphatase
MGPSDKAAFDQLDKTHLDWIAGLPETLTVFNDVFLCHGTPNSDSTYWLEYVEDDGTVRSASLQGIQAEAEGVEAILILCAHTHFPRCIRSPDGRTIVNPGSVGCPAYDDDAPVYHHMQTGTPNASYAVVDAQPFGWCISFRSVPYFSDKASELAAKIVEGLKNRRVLAGRTGVHDNTLKLRPPMVFSRENADHFLEIFDEVLAAS